MRVSGGGQTFVVRLYSANPKHHSLTILRKIDDAIMSVYDLFKKQKSQRKPITIEGFEEGVRNTFGADQKFYSDWQKVEYYLRRIDEVEGVDGVIQHLFLQHRIFILSVLYIKLEDTWGSGQSRLLVQCLAQ